MIARRDHLLVALMAIAMTLSAFSVYVATRAADAADDRLTDLRVAEADATRVSGYIQTVVAHDVGVLADVCESEAARSDALEAVLEGSGDSSAIAEHTIMSRALAPLLMGDRLAECVPAEASAWGTAGYDVRRAKQTLEYEQSLRYSTGTPSDADDPLLDALGTAERSLMTAGLLYATTLALLIAADLLGRRAERPGGIRGRRLRTVRRWLVGAGLVAAAVASTLLIRFAVVGAADAESPLLTIAFVLLIAIVVLVVVFWPWRRRSSRTRRPWWWSELFAAASIVVFSLAAVGLAHVTALEREAEMRADALQSAAQQLQQIGEQAAVRDLEQVAATARRVGEAAAAAALVLGDAQAGMERAADLAQIDAEVSAQADGVDAAIDEQSEVVGACRPAVPDRSVPAPSTLHEELSGDAVLTAWHVRQYQEAAVACDAQTAMARAEARVWARHGSMLTVALVALGLAGFMLSMASGSKREEWVARILRGVGIAGLTAGVAMSLIAIPDLLWRASVPDAEDVPGIAAAIAAARIDPCREGAVADLDAAVEVAKDYGPVFEARGLARHCIAVWSDIRRYSSYAEEGEVTEVLRDYERARATGDVSGASFDQTHGWFAMLHGIQTKDEASVRYGLELTEKAIGELEALFPSSGDALAPGSAVHLARFNRAFALAALDERRAASTAYRSAVACLNPAARCQGGGLLDPDLVDDTILWALADLELLEDADSRAVDEYRLAILQPAPDDEDGVSLSDASLSVYPQEIQVRAGDPVPVDVSIVWYARWSETDPWQLLAVPTRRTMHPGGYLSQRPVPLGECSIQPEYRADVYSDGTRTSLAVEGNTPPADGIRVVSDRLQLSAIVPSDWTEETDPLAVEWCDAYTEHESVDSASGTGVDDGLTWHVGPTSDEGLTVQRIEGVIPGDDIDAFLASSLADWVVRARSADPTMLAPLPEAYFLGSYYNVVAELPDGLRVSAAYEPYAWERDDLGGTLILAALDGTGHGTRVDPAWLSEIAMESPQQLFPTATVGDGFDLEVSKAWELSTPAEAGTEGWVDVLEASAPVGPWLTVARKPDADAGTVSAEVDAWIEELTTGAAGWDDVSIRERRPLSVPGAVAAEWIEYTFVDDDTTWHMWEIFASDGDDLTNVYVSDYESDRWGMQPTIEAMLRSLALEPTENGRSPRTP